jgi:hypothetical protein
MPTTRAQSKVVKSSQITESPLLLLTLPAETRLEIYRYLLLPEFYGDGEEQAYAKLSDLLDMEPSHANNENLSGLTYDALRRDLSTRSDLANPHQPTCEDRKTYSQLLLVCKTIHHEAAPLFFRKTTFFIKEPFRFANTFLRKLAHDKIYSLRYLELRLGFLDFGYIQSPKPIRKIQVLYKLLKLFETYYEELSVLDSIILTLVMDSISPTNSESNLIFRPSDSHSFTWWGNARLDCMWQAGQALAKIKSVAQFELSQSVEEVYEKVPDSRNVTLKGTVARVKLERMM